MVRLPRLQHQWKAKTQQWYDGTGSLFIPSTPGGRHSVVQVHVPVGRFKSSTWNIGSGPSRRFQQEVWGVFPVPKSINIHEGKKSSVILAKMSKSDLTNWPFVRISDSPEDSAEIPQGCDGFGGHLMTPAGRAACPTWWQCTPW